MTLAIVAAVVFLAHVAIWIGMPATLPNQAPAEMIAETA
jgi:hypothetical protein